jgi:hypothetical protein
VCAVRNALVRTSPPRTRSSIGKLCNFTSVGPCCVSRCRLPDSSTPNSATYLDGFSLGTAGNSIAGILGGGIGGAVLMIIIGIIKGIVAKK